jgi:hypothetical protein
MGELFSSLTRAHLATEVLAPARVLTSDPDRDRLLRYERRGELLRGRGEVSTVITYAHHYQPVVSALVA